MLPNPALTPVRIPAPLRPQRPEPGRFPIVATIAPVVMSLAIFAITGSPFALLFAVLGPVVAIGGVVDARVVRRRRVRSEATRFAAEVAAASAEVRAAHAIERRHLDAATPPVGQLVASVGRRAVRWRATEPVQLPVRLGRGAVQSSVAVDGAGGSRGDGADTERLRALHEEAALVTDAAVVIDARTGVAIVGPSPITQSLGRAVVVQLAAMLSPARWSITALEGSWATGLPHRVGVGPPGVVTFSAVGEEDVQVVVAANESSLAAAVGTLVTVSGASGGVRETVFTPELLSVEQAIPWAAVITEVARTDGLAGASALVPQGVTFADLPRGDGMAVAIGASGTGCAMIDLVRDGPHAIVGGMTGSGKSELLVTWLLAMARECSPSEVAFLLFDFKGGSSFGEIAGLRHTVGTITDLDGPGAIRAIASLAAEVRHRERVLAAEGVRSIEALSTSLGRLVIVVDEFAALVADFPLLATQFADIAARGRSLGLHLVLCTQRPAGVIRETVLANAALRISLRVNNRADSTAVIGTDAACAPGSPPGRAWIARDGAAPLAAQVAIATPGDIAGVHGRWNGHAAPRRPWLDPLPSMLDRVPEGAFGLTDRPELQQQPLAVHDPGVHGHLLVVGAARTGKSTALAAIGGAGALVLPADIEGAWDTLVALSRERVPRVVLIDDMDALLASVGTEYDRVLLELVSALLRGAGPARHHVVLSAQRLGPSLQQLASLCDSRLVLRMPNRQEHLLAGASAETFDPDLPPGAGTWRGVRMQVAAVAPCTSPPRTRAALLVPRGAVLAVSPHPPAHAARWRAAGVPVIEVGQQLPAVPEGPVILVASAEGWQAHWAALGQLRQRHPVLVAGCSLAEFRAITRVRHLPPPIADESATGWLVEPDGSVRRVGLPAMDSEAGEGR